MEHVFSKRVLRDFIQLNGLLCSFIAGTGLLLQS